MTEAILKGLGLGMVLALSVGPVIFSVIKQSINKGHRGGMAFVTGVWVSDVFLIVLSNMFTELVSELLRFRNFISYTGSLFLLGLGVYYVLFKKVETAPDDAGEANGLTTGDYARTLLSGFLINTLNPSVFLFWLINATAFAAAHDMTERILIFGVCLLVNVAADTAKVLMAGAVRTRLNADNIRLINRLSGTLLIVFGIALFYGTAVLKYKHP